MNKLLAIQTELKAPKNQYNNFGKYSYRNCEDILEAVKPLLAKHDCVLTISDEIVEIGDRVYVKATALLNSRDGTWATTAYAREAESRKGMDESQITGATSSYARKYALNGLFLIDDNKDADSSKPESKPEPSPFEGCENMDQLKVVWDQLSQDEKKKWKNDLDKRKKEFEEA